MSTLHPNNSLFFFPSNDLPRRTVESLPSLITASENTTRNNSSTHLPEEEITVRTPLVNGRAYTYYTYTKEGLPIKAEDKIPDGGLRAWLVVLGAFLNFCTSFGVTNSFGTFQNYYDSHMKLSSDRSAWIGSLQLAILLLGGIVVGPIFDKRGSRILMIPGALIVLISFLINIFTQDFIALVIAQGVLCGIGNGLLFHPAISAVSEWFDNRRALALGLAISGSSIGGVFWPIVVNVLLKCFGETDSSSNTPDASRALKWTFTIMLAISAPLLAIACCLVRERVPRAQRNAGRKLTVHTEMPISQLLRGCFSRQQVALTVALFLIYLGYLIPFSYIPLFAKEQGIDESMQNALLAICYAGSVFGRILPSWLGDKYGRFNVLILMSLITGVITFSWPFMTTLPTLIAFSILFGFVSGGLMPLGSACVAQISPDLEHIGFRLGMAMAICSIGVLAGGPISGHLWEMYFDESGMQFFAGGATILGAVVLTVARFLSRREVLVAF